MEFGYDRDVSGNGNPRWLDHKDAEIGRLRRELRESRSRGERAVARAEELRERFKQFSELSKSFSRSMHVRAVERKRFKRRFVAQHAIGSALSGTANIDEVAPKVFAILAEELGWHLGVLWMLDETSKVLRCQGMWRASGEPPSGLEETSHNTTFARGVGLPGRVWARAEPAWIQDLPGDSSVPEKVAAEENLRTALAFPIRTEVQVVGVFELFSPDDTPPDEDLARTVVLIGDQIGLFLERRHAEEERDKLLTQRWMARVELEERERISRELHDRVAHSMGVAHQSLQLYEAFQETQPSKAAEKLALAKEMTMAALESTRNLSMELRRSETAKGIAPALEALVEVAVPPGMSARLRTNGDESRLPPHVRSQIFSILREAMRNAVRHSGAHHILVEFDVTPEEVTGSVEDDGQGLEETAEKDTYDANNGVGGGLKSMKERAELLGGHLRLLSRTGQGTRVEVAVPLDRSDTRNLGLIDRGATPDS